MQKLIPTLVLVFVLFVTAAIGQSGYGNQVDSSRSRNLGHAKAYIETSLSFTRYRDPQITEPFLMYLKDNIDPPITTGFSNQATGRNKLKKGRQTFELKLSATDLLDGYDQSKIRITRSSPEESVYYFCASILGGEVAVGPENPISNGQGILEIRQSARCLELALDVKYRVQTNVFLTETTLLWGILSHQRKE